MIQTFENFDIDLHCKQRDARQTLEEMGHYKDADGFWLVGESLDISNKKEFSYKGKLTAKFKVIRGDFSINSLDLTTLEGCPVNIDGDFSCEQNLLTNLIGSPKTIKGYFSCMNNYLTTLEGGPSNVEEDYFCNKNKLTSLKGIQSIINMCLYCSSNNLTSLKGGPSEVLGIFYCSHNKLSSLEGGPYIVKDNIDTYDNINNLKIEKEFIESGSYKINSSQVNSYWLDLLTYMIKEKIDLEKVKGWPEGFLNNNIKKSIKGISKFNL